MSADLQHVAPRGYHIGIVILGKLSLAGLGLVIGLVAGVFIGLVTGLISFAC